MSRYAFSLDVGKEMEKEEQDEKKHLEEMGIKQPDKKKEDTEHTEENNVDNPEKRVNSEDTAHKEKDANDIINGNDSSNNNSGSNEKKKDYTYLIAVAIIIIAIIGIYYYSTYTSAATFDKPEIIAPAVNNQTNVSETNNITGTSPNLFSDNPIIEEPNSSVDSEITDLLLAKLAVSQ